MSHLVIDSSAVVEYLRWTTTGERVAARIARPDIVVHAPHLLSIEVVSAFRGLVLGGLVDADDAAESASHLPDLDAERHPVETFATRIWELRNNLTVYDATYVALAEVLGCPLVTIDAKFDNPTVRRLIDVEVIS